MNLTPIRDLVQKTRQIDPKKLGIASFVYVDISSVDKDTKRISAPQTISVGDAPSRARKEIKANDVLVATVRPNLNGVAIVPPQYDNQIASTGFCVLRADTEQLNPNYLFYFTQTGYFISHLTELSTGAGYPAVSDEDILNTRIPLPPSPEQKRITSLLRRADRLRQLRRTAHDLGDALLQSVFLEMFYNTEGKWELSTVEDLAKKKNNAIRTGPFGSQLLHSEFTETGDVLVLGIDNAVQNEFSWGKPRFITREKYKELKRYTVFPGDLIITIMATNGRVTIVPDNIPLAINTKHLCCITLDQKICLPKFLHSCLLYHPSVLKQMGISERGAVMPGLNMEIIKNLVIPVPPLSLQEEFAGVVVRIEGLRGRMSEAERQVEGLFESLLAESFSS